MCSLDTTLVQQVHCQLRKSLQLSAAVDTDVAATGINAPCGPSLLIG